jgi:hypothetical protein
MKGLQLYRDSLSHEKYLDEARARVAELEAEVLALKHAQGAKGIAPASPDPNQGPHPDDAKKRGWTWWRSDDGKKTVGIFKGP